ncbi:MAG: AbrB/MazE/SpoVT family DNA-binding domain-containing protein [Clostridia bacterium]|nr:AbrB/MazE/SpoVT family DNA-binding domain-containing protein [Clostridia bacterium]MBR3152226.1 AbrB/MazE/SpoVT family DNA-binding domain-containing protein [Clostridia bacterium]MBR3152237.1 AbrB/MazE/SpoVT family DNA-binding domain-containing protein [Clostridia bacterium]
MKLSTGIVRRVDELGRIVIPIEMRNSLNISQKDPVEISMDGSSIILRKYENRCVFCGALRPAIRFNGKLMCSKCLKQINEENKDKE